MIIWFISIPAEKREGTPVKWGGGGGFSGKPTPAPSLATPL